MVCPSVTFRCPKLFKHVTSQKYKSIASFIAATHFIMFIDEEILSLLIKPTFRLMEKNK